MKAITQNMLLAILCHGFPAWFVFFSINFSLNSKSNLCIYQRLFVSNYSLAAWATLQSHNPTHTVDISRTF